MSETKQLHLKSHLEFFILSRLLWAQFLLLTVHAKVLWVQLSYLGHSLEPSAHWTKGVEHLNHFMSYTQNKITQATTLQRHKVV